MTAWNKVENKISSIAIIICPIPRYLQDMGVAGAV